MLDLATGNRSETIGSLRLEDGTVTTGTGTLTVAGSIASDHLTAGDVSTISGNLNLGGFPRIVSMGGISGGSLNIDAVVSNGGILFSGGSTGSTLNLTAANTFAGNFQHNGDATVNIGHNAALGTGTVVLPASAGATRFFSVINGAKTVANEFLLNSSVHFALPHDLTLTGTISGSGAISKDGVGTLTLGGSASSFAGASPSTRASWSSPPTTRWATSSGGVVLGAGVPLELPGVNYTAIESLTINGGGGGARPSCSPPPAPAPGPAH